MCLKALSVQFMFVGSTLLLRVSVCFSHCDYLLSSLIKACLTFPRLLRVPASAQFVTEDPTNTVTSVCSLRFCFRLFPQCFVSVVYIPYGSPPSPGIPPPPAGAGGEIARGSHQTVPGPHKPHHLPGRRALCVLRCQLEHRVQSAVVRGWPSS